MNITGQTLDSLVSLVPDDGSVSEAVRAGDASVLYARFPPVADSISILYDRSSLVPSLSSLAEEEDSSSSSSSSSPSSLSASKSLVNYYYKYYDKDRKIDMLQSILEEKTQGPLQTQTLGTMAAKIHSPSHTETLTPEHTSPLKEVRAASEEDEDLLRKLLSDGLRLRFGLRLSCVLEEYERLPVFSQL